MTVEQQNGNLPQIGSDRLATGLGWFSIGLGLAEILAPGPMADLIGVEEDSGTRSLMRFYGVREIVAGVGILSQPQPAAWLWGRVAGDMLDLATLAGAMNSEHNDRKRVAFAGAAVLGVTALDVLCAQQLSRQQTDTEEDRRGLERVTRTITVNRSPDEVYRFWRDIENLPRFMSHLESVRVLDDRRSHWVAKGPAGRKFEWDAEIDEDQPGSKISWRSTKESDVYNRGSVRFERAPGGRGAVVRVELEYAPPGGVAGQILAKMTGSEPGQEIAEDLRAFKQIIETGEVVRSDASIHRRMHAAQPPESWQPA
jgi:uncharacterized membrane protein